MSEKKVIETIADINRTGCEKDCTLCKGRPFGFAPCPTEHKVDGCPGSDCCENWDMCLDILMREWPLAALATRLSEEGVI